MDTLFIEGALLPLGTAAALVPVLAAGLALGGLPATASRPEEATGPELVRRLVLTALVVGTGAAVGLFLPRALPADVLAPLALGAALPPCLVTICALRVPVALVATLAAAGGMLGAGAAFARFLPGELPPDAYAGALVGLVSSALLPALLAGTVRTFRPGPVTAVGTRVAASWLAAVALLMLALQLRPI